MRDTALGRISPESGQVFLDEMEITEEDFRSFKEIRIVAAGTSRHAGLAGKVMIERLARVPVEVHYASEFRYHDPLVDAETLTLLITQSGETADTIAGQREAKAKLSKTLAICNVLSSMVPREAHGTIYTHAGPEIGVGSTKTFTAQLTALYLFAVYLAQTRDCLPVAEAKKLLAALTALPKQLESVLQNDDEFEDFARHFYRSSDFLFLGRGVHFPVALEGALKMKKFSYIHAEACPAGEMKHGPIALIADGYAGGRDRHLRLERRGFARPLRAHHFQHQGGQGARGHHPGAGNGRRSRGERHGRPSHRAAPHQRVALIHPGSGAAAIAGIPHRRAARLRRGSAPQPGQVGNGGMKKEFESRRSKVESFRQTAFALDYSTINFRLPTAFSDFQLSTVNF